jgi:hypothetical protein
MPSKNERMLGQSPEDKGMYRFNTDKKGNKTMDPVDFKVMVDIQDRDHADIDKGSKPNASEADKKSAKEAKKRRNKLYEIQDGKMDDETGKGFSDEEVKKTRSRLQTLYSKHMK